MKRNCSASDIAVTSSSIKNTNSVKNFDVINRQAYEKTKSDNFQPLHRSDEMTDLTDEVCFDILNFK